jgi:hypothetical protein
MSHPVFRIAGIHGYATGQISGVLATSPMRELVVAWTRRSSK